jgi:hypothetical protein
MQARGFDGELRALPSPPLARSAALVAVAVAALLVAWEVLAHTWLPRL